MDIKPTVYIYESGASNAALQEIAAGLEEEGIPWEIIACNTSDAKALAHAAADHSRLRVGIGITVKAAALQVRNLPENKPVFLIDIDDNLASLRKLGINAARAVKGGVFV